ncbi:RNA polymerase III subunit C82 [Dissophora globulifera]|uniref:DNA-directed RNA polymerase III subunit RPC3 n=1 Tax=Dissophora globulifera TaxID=979702 RepID=A0A9P6URR9_9FUNG|nr:RNA polymerase III subunit C82 [Dissophora globulifera]
MPVGLIASVTQLKPRQVREALFVLIQHNIGVYAEVQERNRIVTYYEVHREELLHRAMIPKVLHSSQVWYERDGAAIARALLANGKMLVGDCTNIIMAGEGLQAGTRTHTHRVQTIKKAFTRMVKEKCLIAVRPSDSLTETDRVMAEEKRETDKMALPPTAAELASIRRTLGAQKIQDQSGAIIGLKRTLETGDIDEPEGEKRRRLMVNDDLTIVEEVESDVYFKINYERYIIRWRNMQIAELYEVRLNATAKKIMNTMLTLAEDRMARVQEDFSSPVNVMLLLNNLPKDINLVETLVLDPAEMEPNSVNSRLKAGECLEKYIQVLLDDLMQILRKDAGRSGQYIVSLKAAARILKRNLIQSIVASRFGAPYLRIMNMLLEKGKLEEKQIARYSMMPVKDVREKLTTLCTFGILNLQEVPKTNDRTPSRTFYLWEVLLERAASGLVDRLYHTMSNLRQRRFVERAKRAVLLEKCERTDVRDNDALLNAAEKRELATLTGVLEMLEIQELRIAEMVITLKEY